jgi:hypothetical protein
MVWQVKHPFCVSVNPQDTMAAAISWDSMTGPFSIVTMDLTAGKSFQKSAYSNLIEVHVAYWGTEF